MAQENRARYVAVYNDSFREDDEVEAFMKKNGFDVTIREAGPFAEFLKAQDAQWKAVIEAAGYAK